MNSKKLNMKSKKLLWMIAVMVLIAGTIAADVEGAKFSIGKLFEGKWAVILVNGLIIFVILLAISTLLNPDKGVKVPYVLLALLIALLVGFKLADMFLWQYGAIKDFMHVKVLVNLVIVLGILFVINGIITRNLTSKEAKIAVGLLAVILAISIVKPDTAYSDDTYKYVWQWSLGTQLRFYLFGLHSQSELLPDGTKATASWYTEKELDEALGLRESIEKEEKPLVLGEEQPKKKGPPEEVSYGILTGTAIWTFLLGSIVIAMMFTLVMEIKGPAWVYYILSVLIASTIANVGGGSAKTGLIGFGQVIVFILFFRAFGGAKDRVWVPGLIAWALTSYIFALAFPCDVWGAYPIDKFAGAKCTQKQGPSAEDLNLPPTERAAKEGFRSMDTEELRKTIEELKERKRQVGKET